MNDQQPKPDSKKKPGSSSSSSSDASAFTQNGSTRLIELLTRSDVQAMLSTCGSRSVKGVRDCALMATLYGTGVRVLEALGLFPRDIDWEKGTLTVRHGKGNKRRVVGIDRGCLALLEKWIELRRRELPGSLAKVPVFCAYRKGHEGKPLCRKTIWRMVQQRAARAGIEKRVHPHGFRHTHASELSAEKMDLSLLSLQLGHASVATTAKYVRALRPEAVIEFMSEREVL